MLGGVLDVLVLESVEVLEFFIQISKNMGPWVRCANLQLVMVAYVLNLAMLVPYSGADE